MSEIQVSGCPELLKSECIFTINDRLSQMMLGEFDYGYRYSFEPQEISGSRDCLW